MKWTSLLEISPILVIAAIAFPLARIDIEEHRLPNKYTLPTMLYSLFAIGLVGLLNASWSRLVLALLLMFATLVIGYFLSVKDLLGFGDSKFLASANLILGWFNPVLAIAAITLGFGLAAFASLLALARKRIGIRDRIALGPYLISSFLVISLIPVTKFLGYY